MADLVQDAMCTETYTPIRNFASTRVTPQIFQEIVKDLEPREIVSIIFLMVDGFTDLCKVIKDIKEDPKTAFTQLSSQKSWAEKLIECLFVIKNKHVVKRMRFNNKEIQYLENILVTKEHNVSSYINRAMKSLYFLCENLDDNDVKKLVTDVNGKLGHRPLDDDSTVCYLEIYILEWLEQKYISIAPDKFDLSNLLKNLKRTGLSNLPFDFYYWENNIESINRNDRDSQICSQTLDNRNTLQCSNSGNSLSNMDSDVMWASPDHLRLCIIINQINFIDAKRFLTRESSIKDEEKLKETFKGCGFIIETHRNITEQGMIEILESLNDNSYVKYGAIVLCILSHGFTGEVLFSDDNTVQIETIKMKFCCRKLRNVFKFLILQSCQGQQAGLVERQPGQLVRDGPSDSNNPLYQMHFCLFQATIKNFAAMRDTKHGSWFIGDLCQEIQEANKPIDIRELIKNVNIRVTTRRGRLDDHPLQYAVQVPLTENTITIPYILPKFQET